MDVISNWLSRPQKSSLPEPTALQVLRSRQIEQLRCLGGRVVEVLRDQEYRITVDEKSGLHIKISLPPQFPQERPVVIVSPRANHPWISEQQVVIGCPGLNNFMVHSDLSKILLEIIEEFRHNPPVIITQTVLSSWSAPTAVPSSYLPQCHLPNQTIHDTYGQTSYPEISRNNETSNCYNITSLASKLNEMSLSEIKSLKDDDANLFEMVDSLPQLKKIMAFKETLHEQLEILAKENLAKKYLLEEKKQTVLEKYDQLNELRNKFDSSSKRQDELLQMFSHQALQDNIKVAAMEAEEAAEAVAEDFLEGKMSVDEFNKMFMAQRTLSHLRRVKEEKCSVSSGWTF